MKESKSTTIYALFRYKEKKFNIKKKNQMGKSLMKTVQNIENIIKTYPPSSVKQKSIFSKNMWEPRIIECASH